MAQYFFLVFLKRANLRECFPDTIWFQLPDFKLPDMPGGMPSLRRTCLPAQTMHESSQFTVSFIPFSCYTIHEDISTLQSTAW